MIKKIFLLPFFFFLIIKNSSAWEISTGNIESHKFFSESKINIDNIKRLKLEWVFEGSLVENDKYFRDNNQTTPIYTGDSIVSTTLNGHLISLNPVNGSIKWKKKYKNPLAKRGLTYHNKNIYIPSSDGIMVINESDGELNKNFGNNGIIGTSDDQNLSLVPPIIENNFLYSAHLKKITKYSIPSGKVIWSLNLNGSRVWSPISYDKKNKILAFNTSNLINLIGKTDISEIDYSNSLIIVNSENGRVKCKFKDVKHDHWDLDMVGPPIIVENKIYAFSKTGSIFLIDSTNCKQININDFNRIKTITTSDIENQTYSNFQDVYTKEKNIVNLDYHLDEYLDYLKKNKKSTEYIKFRTRNALYGEKFIPISINQDVIMNGIHGGFEWPGGSFDKKNNQILISSNHYPWVLRAFFIDKSRRNKTLLGKIQNKFMISNGKNIYIEKCQSCHRSNRSGVYESEFFGDKYIPSLVGISKKKIFSNFNDLNWFNYQHQFLDKSLKINKQEINDLKNYFLKDDNYLLENDLMETRGVWQLLLNEDGKFASIPPWGKITSFDAQNLEINWQIPYDINFGGLLTTNSNIFFATGTPDGYIRAYDSKNGKEIWNYKMELAGSTAPMTFVHKGKQFLIINASGGKFYGFEKKNKDLIYAFSLN